MTVIGRWMRLDPARRTLLLHAVAALCAASLKVRMLPFARIADGLGTMRPPRPDAECEAVEPANLARAKDVRWAVNAAARRLPFECACLVRALAAHALCRSCGIMPVLHMGAQAGQQGHAETHAWLTAAGIGVTGYPLPPDMVEVGCFCA
jgi:hypothetical protein